MRGPESKQPRRGAAPGFPLLARAPPHHPIESAAVAARKHDRVPDEGPDNLAKLPAFTSPDPADIPGLRRRVASIRVPRVRDDLLALELARGATREEAAKAVGVSERTVYNRLEDPEFRKQVQAIRRQTMLTALAVLVDGSIKAARRLVVLVDEASEDEVKLKAAQAILGGARNIAELAEHGDQIRALHDRLDQVQSQQQKAGKKRIGVRPHIRVDKLPEP